MEQPQREIWDKLIVILEAQSAAIERVRVVASIALALAVGDIALRVLGL